MIARRGIRKNERLAIYLRDGLACVYCGQAVADGAKLTLNHLKPYSKGGSNNATNLVTCCAICKASRGTRTLKVWTEMLAGYRGKPLTSARILSDIKTTTGRKLDITTANALIARRGGGVAACKA